MKNDRFTNWLQRVFHTRPSEISCTECFDAVSRYVDLELKGEDVAAAMPEVPQHLEQCTACREEYETLRDLSRLENEGGPPSTQDLRNLIQ